MRIARLFTVSSQKLKKFDGGLHTLVLISTSAIFTENGGNLDHLMLWNIMAMISHKMLNVGYFVCSNI